MYRWVGHVVSAVGKSNFDQVLSRKRPSLRYGPPFGVVFSRRALPSQVAGTPPLNNGGLKNILVEMLNNVGHPTRCPQPPNSVRLPVSYIVQCLHNDVFKATLCKGGVTATCLLFFLDSAGGDLGRAQVVSRRRALISFISQFSPNVYLYV